MKMDFARSIYEYLLENGIAVRYFKPDYLRITAGSQEEDEEFLRYFEKYIVEKYVYMGI